MNPDRLADLGQIGLLIGMGALAGAASFRHVHDLAAAHGQHGWFAWASAVSIEAMSLAAGLEIRRAHHTGRPAKFATAALIGGVGLSLSAQVAQAEPTAWGWILAAVPAAAFLVVLKFALRRLDTAPATQPEATDKDTPAQESPATGPVRSSVTDELAAYLAAR